PAPGTGPSDPVTRGIRGGPPVPRPQGPGGEAIAAAGLAVARRAAGRRGGASGGGHPRRPRLPLGREQGERDPDPLRVPAARPHLPRRPPLRPEERQRPPPSRRSLAP